MVGIRREHCNLELVCQRKLPNQLNSADRICGVRKIPEKKMFRIMFRRIDYPIYYPCKHQY